MGRLWLWGNSVGAMARLRRQESLQKDNKHLKGQEKKRRLGNLRPEDVAPAVREKIVDVVREPTNAGLNAFRIRT